MTAQSAVATAAKQLATDYVNKREIARQRRRDEVALKKERAVIALTEFNRLAAIKAEEQAEEQTPRQQRGEVVGLTATIIKAARDEARKRGEKPPTVITPILLRGPIADHDPKRGGYRRADPLMRMHKADPRQVTRVHLGAARKFSEDYEVGIEGGCSPGGLRVAVDGNEAPDIAEIRFAAMDRYRAACDAIGPTLRTAVQLSVLHKVSLAAMAPRLGMTQERASGWLLGGLDRLADHYWPDRAGRMEEVERALMVDMRVVDIPQERLGRRRVA